MWTTARAPGTMTAVNAPQPVSEPTSPPAPEPASEAASEPASHAWLAPGRRRPVWTDRVEVLLWVTVLALSVLTPVRDAHGGANTPFKAQLDSLIGEGGICVFKRVTGIPCAGCGLTRAFVQLGHGELHAALAFHPLAPFVFAWVALKLIEAAIFSATGKRLKLPVSNRWRWRYYGALGGGFLGLALWRIGGGLLALLG